eukprot:gene26120-biopygen14171
MQFWNVNSHHGTGGKVFGVRNDRAVVACCMPTVPRLQGLLHANGANTCMPRAYPSVWVTWGTRHKTTRAKVIECKFTTTGRRPRKPKCNKLLSGHTAHPTGRPPKWVGAGI